MERELHYVFEKLICGMGFWVEEITLRMLKINMRDVILGDGGKRKEAAETVASSLARSIAIMPAGGGVNGDA